MPRDVAEQVRWRDRDRCRRCGTYTPGGSLHHRQGRGGADPHRAANLILLCGSGTTGCHGHVHSNPSESYESGLMVRRLGVDVPEGVPIITPRGAVWLYADGTASTPQKEH